MRDRRRALGAEGEARAASHLVRQGYRIVARNVRAGGVEIDLIAMRRGLVVFVEVKARRSRHWGAGAEAVNAHKRARLLRGAAAWLAERRRANDPLVRGASRVRFDVVVWEPDARGELRIAHLEGAFDAER